jgi:hypothetical protein
MSRSTEKKWQKMSKNILNDEKYGASEANKKFMEKVKKSSIKKENKEAGQLSLDDVVNDKLWKKQVLSEIKAMLTSGSSARDILGKFEALAAARLVLITLFEPSSKVSVTAVRDILDRIGGKAIETKKVAHEFADLPDEQLDAMLNTLQCDLGLKKREIVNASK